MTQKRDRCTHLLSVLEEEILNDEKREIEIYGLKKAEFKKRTRELVKERSETADRVMRIMTSYNLIPGVEVADYLRYTVELGRQCGVKVGKNFSKGKKKKRKTDAEKLEKVARREDRRKRRENETANQRAKKAKKLNDVNEIDKDTKMDRKKRKEEKRLEMEAKKAEGKVLDEEEVSESSAEEESSDSDSSSESSDSSGDDETESEDEEEEEKKKEKEEKDSKKKLKNKNTNDGNAEYGAGFARNRNRPGKKLKKMNSKRVVSKAQGERNKLARHLSLHPKDPYVDTYKPHVLADVQKNAKLGGMRKAKRTMQQFKNAGWEKNIRTGNAEKDVGHVPALLTIPDCYQTTNNGGADEVEKSYLASKIMSDLRTKQVDKNTGALRRDAVPLLHRVSMEEGETYSDLVGRPFYFMTK